MQPKLRSHLMAVWTPICASLTPASAGPPAKHGSSTHMYPFEPQSHSISTLFIPISRSPPCRSLLDALGLLYRYAATMTWSTLIGPSGQPYSMIGEADVDGDGEKPNTRYERTVLDHGVPLLLETRRPPTSLAWVARRARPPVAVESIE